MALSRIDILSRIVEIQQKFIEPPCAPDTAAGDFEAFARFGQLAVALRQLGRAAGNLRKVLAVVRRPAKKELAAVAFKFGIDVNNLILLLNAFVAALPAILAMFGK